MAYVKQKGNCFEACLASILEKEVHEIPDIEKMGDNWIEIIKAYVAGFDWKMIVDSYSPFELNGCEDPYIVSGPSPRGDFHHAVIHQKGELIFDPYPGGEGLADGELTFWKLEYWGE